MRSKRAGFILGPDGLIRLSPSRIRSPDISFIRRDQTPNGRLPKKLVPDLYPNLAVEVLSPGYTKREMAEKLDDYFGSGCELAWLVDPASKTIRVFTNPHSETTLRPGDILDGGTVLPGFTVEVGDVFDAVNLGEGD